MDQTQRSKFTDVVFFLSDLPRHGEEQGSFQGKSLDPPMALLRTWQSERLAHTHADLLASQRFGPACNFFLSDVYAPQDFSQRDQDIEYLYAMMSRFLPDFLLSLVRKAIALNDLTNALDQALLQVLVNDLGMTDSISSFMYAEAYRLCNNHDERVKQIELLVEVGKQVELGTRIPLVGMTLRLARSPARHAGWHELQDFLERGFQAFKTMRGAAQKFLDILQARELLILDQIYTQADDPFDL